MSRLIHPLAVAGLALAIGLSACGAGDGGQAASPRPLHTLTVMVTNQSFAIPDAHIAVSIDGREVINDRFPVGSQHHVVSFEFELPEGEHTVRATSDDGAADTEWVIDLRGDRWTRVAFWYYPGDHGEPFFEWIVSDRIILIL